MFRCILWDSTIIRATLGSLISPACVSYNTHGTCNARYIPHDEPHGSSRMVFAWSSVSDTWDSRRSQKLSTNVRSVSLSGKTILALSLWRRAHFNILYESCQSFAAVKAVNGYNGCGLLIFIHRALQVFLSTALSTAHAVGIAFLGWLVGSLGYVWHRFKIMQKSANQNN